MTVSPSLPWSIQQFEGGEIRLKKAMTFEEALAGWLYLVVDYRGDQIEVNLEEYFGSYYFRVNSVTVLQVQPWEGRTNVIPITRAPGYNPTDLVIISSVEVWDDSQVPYAPGRFSTNLPGLIDFDSLFAEQGTQEVEVSIDIEGTNNSFAWIDDFSVLVYAPNARDEVELAMLNTFLGHMWTEDPASAIVEYSTNHIKFKMQQSEYMSGAKFRFIGPFVDIQSSGDGIVTEAEAVGLDPFAGKIFMTKNGKAFSQGAPNLVDFIPDSINVDGIGILEEIPVTFETAPIPRSSNAMKTDIMLIRSKYSTSDDEYATWVMLGGVHSSIEGPVIESPLGLPEV